MPVAWSASGTFSQSLPTDDIFFANVNRTTTIASIPSGSYGSGARLIFLLASRVGPAAVFLGPSAQAHTLSFGAGSATRTVLLGDQNTSVGNRWYEFKINVYQLGSFDGGTSVNVTTVLPTYWQVAQAPNLATTVPLTSNLVGDVTTSHWTTDLFVGQNIWVGSTPTTIVAIADDNHMSTSITPFIPPPQSVTMFAYEPEESVWIAALQTFDQALPIPPLVAPPSGQGNAAYVLNSPGGSVTWSSSSFDGLFGNLPVTGSTTTPTMAQFLSGDPNCLEAFGVVAGVRSSGLGFTGDLVNSVPNWSSVASRSSGLWPVYVSMADWTRLGDTSTSWAGMPSTAFGQSGIIMFPSGTIGAAGARSFAIVVG